MTPRRLIIAFAAVHATAAVALIVLSFIGAMSPGLSVLLLVAVGAVGAGLVAALYARVADGKALRIDAKVKRQEQVVQHIKDEVASLGSAVDDLGERIRLDSRTSSLLLNTTLGESRLESARQTELLRELRDGLGSPGRSVQTDPYPQIEAFIDLRHLFRPHAPLPALRETALPPDLMRAVVCEVATVRPRLIVECGSGASTVWLGYAARKYGGGRVVTLEHDERFADETYDLLRMHGLLDTVEVRHVPLASWAIGGESWSWYAPSGLERLRGIDLVLVDGPLPDARYPALPLLLPHCAEEVSIVLGDTDRSQMRRMAHRWLAEHKELNSSVLPVERGAFLFRRVPR
ncbi:class I SAM-dependent methyltransferase [Streptosporangium sp. OZ121]|uniref:class I SAM-dependent methyltransferase n=1 Tax=Streptosporangium sp. OZ121 TaxID=3444183 RepID=UPI003F79408D